MLRVNGFYGHIKQHDLRSVGMFLGFMLAFQIVAAVVMTVPMFFIDIYKIPIINPIAYFKSWGIPVFVVGVVFFLFRYAAHLKDLQESLGFKTVTKHSDPRLFRAVEPVAIAAGIKMPEVAILESQSLNAFACGLSEDAATVVVTRGLLNTLDDEELEAVIAHEVTHIKNGDIALLAVANTALSSIKWLEKWNMLKFGKKRSIFLIFMPVLIIIMMFVNFVMNVGTTIAKISRLLIASSREYVADAEAVRLTHNPSALISALQKIEGRSAIEGLDEVADAMMIDGAVEGAFATHPTISERIAALSQHAGAMVHGNASRKDTRSQAGRSFGGFQPQVQAQAQFQPQPQTQPFAQPTGLFQRFASAPQTGTKKSLIDRVNADRTTNMFGINPSIAKFMRIGAFAFIGLSLLSSFTMQRNMQSIQKSITSEFPAGSVSSETKPKSKKTAAMAKKASAKSTDPKSKPVLTGLNLRGTSDQ